jgi:hypothetical protein
MVRHRNELAIADALRLFEGLTGFHPQSAKELKGGYRSWMKEHHPDITGKHDALSLESVQWMNAAYDVLKARDWTKPNHTEEAADPKSQWTDVGASSRVYPDFDDEYRWREEQLRRWRERQEKERQEKEEEHRRCGDAIKRRNDALKKRPIWQKILWGTGDSLTSDTDGLVNPGLMWCCWNLFVVMLGTVFSIGLVTGFLLVVISSFLGPLHIGGSVVAAISIGATLIIFSGIALTYACIAAWKGLCWLVGGIFGRNTRPIKIMPFVWKTIWKAPVLVVALLVASFGASQVGWSGAELVVNSSTMEPLERLATIIVLALATAITAAPIILIYRLAKPGMWLFVPVLLYVAIVPGAWNGIAGDFDATRVASIRERYANGYALAHMSPRARYLTCKDERINLTDDAKAVCEGAFNTTPGERSPRSERIER